MTQAAFDFDKHGHLVEISPTRRSASLRTLHSPPPQPLAKPPAPGDLRLDRRRDALLTSFGRATLDDRYLLPGESYQDMFARVACAYADDEAHAQRLYDAMSRLWFMPATPILSNGGTTRGLPISCFLNSVPDSLEGIVATWNENVALASNGGGIGTYWGRVRSIGEKVKGNGETSGIIPFIHVMDGLTLAISQGSLRRGSAAVYLDIHHPEIEEFLEIRKATGDFNRKGLNLHHGVNVTDAFMEAVATAALFPLKSPRTGETLRSVDARQLWQRILETRIQTGEPYLLFIDQVNRALPKHQRDLGLRVSTSNSIPAAEHSTMTSWGREREALAYANMLERFDGMVAVVSDSYDLDAAVSDIWGGALHEKVLERNGVLVVRPDSGDPVETPLRTLKILWEKFGGAVNGKGYRVLDPHIRVIQGDGMTIDSIARLIDRLVAEGFAIDNIAFGMGGGLLQQVNRDTLRFAMKANAMRDDKGVWRDVSKSPVTDPAKGSKAGRQSVVREGGRLIAQRLDATAPGADLLTPV